MSKLIPVDRAALKKRLKLSSSEELQEPEEKIERAKKPRKATVKITEEEKKLRAEADEKYASPEYVKAYTLKNWGEKKQKAFESALKEYPKFAARPWRLFHFVVMIGLSLKELKFVYENEILGEKRVSLLGDELEEETAK